MVLRQAPLNPLSPPNPATSATFRPLQCGPGECQGDVYKSTQAPVSVRGMAVAIPFKAGSATAHLFSRGLGQGKLFTCP